MKLELGYSTFSRLEISKTKKICEFLLFPWQHDDFKMAELYFFLKYLRLAPVKFSNFLHT